MRGARSIAGRLSYANVVATLALFVALGGASYAAIVLPANSVGTKQLRPGAVTRAALGFPLGVESVTDDSAQRLYKSFCNSPNPPGIHIEGICARPLLSHVQTPGRQVQMSLHAPGRLLISAIAGLHSEGPADATVNVAISLIVDGRPVHPSEVQLTGDQILQQPLQLLVSVGPGKHTVGVSVGSVRYSSYLSADVLVKPVSLIVSALPGL